MRFAIVYATGELSTARSLSIQGGRGSNGRTICARGGATHREHLGRERASTSIWVKAGPISARLGSLRLKWGLTQRSWSPLLRHCIQSAASRYGLLPYGYRLEIIERRPIPISQVSLGAPGPHPRHLAATRRGWQEIFVRSTSAGGRNLH